MNKVAKIFSYIAFVFAFCCMAIGYAAVQDELLVNGIVSVDGYILKYDLSAADIEGYTYDTTTKTVEIEDIYYDTETGKNYKVVGIAANGFSSEKINEVKEKNSDFQIDATTIEAFVLSEGISQIGANAFNGLSNLKSFNTTKNNNTYFTFEDKILFKLENENKRTLVYYSFDKQETYYVVDETKIIAITDGAFSNNTYCTAILTSYYDDNAWGSPAAVMISTVGFLDTVTNVEGNVDEGYKVYLQKAKSDEAVVLQGNDDPDHSIYGNPQNVLVAEDTDGSYISIDKDLCKPCSDHQHYSQIYLSSWQTLAYAHLTDDKTLEIHNCRSAIVGGEIYQWVNDNDYAHKILPNSTLYTLPSGTVEGSDSLPSGFASWSDKKAEIIKVKVVDNIAPSGVTDWFQDMTACTEMDLAKLNTENVTTMYGMFWGCEKLLALDVSNFNTSNVTSMSYMFYECKSVEKLDLSRFDTSNVAYIRNMFSYCENLTELNVSGFDTTDIQNMQGMFLSCYKLKKLDLSSFNTENVTNMMQMFRDAYALTDLNVSSFNTEKVQNMFQMFNNCYALKDLDVNNFNTSKVSNMSYMFSGNLGLTSLDLSSFNTSKVQDMSYMFRNCTYLTTITVSDKFVISSVTSARSMFEGCNNIVGGNGTAFNSNVSYTTNSNNNLKYAYIDGANGQRGYFTAATGVTVSSANVTINVDSAIGEYTIDTSWIFLNEPITITLNDTSITQVALTYNETSETVTVTNCVFTIPAAFVIDGATISVTVVNSEVVE